MTGAILLAGLVGALLGSMITFAAQIWRAHVDHVSAVNRIRIEKRLAFVEQINTMLRRLERELGVALDQADDDLRPTAAEEAVELVDDITSVVYGSELFLTREEFLLMIQFLDAVRKQCVEGMRASREDDTWWWEAHRLMEMQIEILQQTFARDIAPRQFSWSEAWRQLEG